MKEGYPKHLFYMALSLLAAVIGLGVSYQALITPRDMGGRVSGLHADGWLENGSRFDLSGVAPYINTASFYFDEWRPPAAGPANISLSLCDEEVGKFSVTSSEPFKIRIKRGCSDKKLTINASNPFIGSDSDARPLAVKLKKMEISSPLGPPIVSLKMVLVTTAAIFFLLCVWCSAIPEAAMSLALSLCVFSLFLLARTPDLNLFGVTPLFLFLLSLGGGYYVARVRPRFFTSEGSTDNRDLWPLALIITLGALALRLYGISFGLPENYHPDEVPKVNAVTRMMESGSLNPQYFLHPSLLLYSTYFFSWIFSLLGAEGSRPEILLISGRMVSVVSGTLSVYLTYLIGRRLLSESSALVGAFLLAVFPLHVTCSRYLKEDALLVLMLLVTFLLALRAVQENRKGLLYAAAFSGGLAASSKYTGLLAVAFVLGSAWYKSGKLSPDIPWLKSALFSLCLFPFAFVMASPYTLLDLPTFIDDFSYEKRHMERGHASAIDAWSQYWMYYYKRALAPGVTWAILVIATFMIGVGVRLRSIAILALTAGVLIFYLPAEWIKAKPAPQPDRYVLPCLPFIALLSANFVVHLWKGNSKLVARFCILAVLSLPLIRTIELASEISPDTRERMRSWMVQTLPKGTRILVDWRVYSPNLPADYFDIKFIDRGQILEELDPKKLRNSGFDFLVISSLFYTRYTKDPNPGVPGRAIIKELFAKLPVAYEISPDYGTYGFHNPSLTLLKLR